MLAQAVQISNIVNGRVVYASENLENDRIEVFLYDLSSSQATRFWGYDRRPKENSIIEITSIYYDGADVLLALTSATSLEDESSGFARVLKKDVRSGQETVLLQLNLPYRLTVFDDRNQELLYARASMGERTRFPRPSDGKRVRASILYREDAATRLSPFTKSKICFFRIE